jgi:hypothetical protein
MAHEIVKSDALKSLCPNAVFSINTNTVIWASSNEESQPSEAQIDAEIIKLQASYDAQAYARKRQAEYPSISDLVVALYDTDDKSAVEAKRASVKLKYPKPE